LRVISQQELNWRRDRVRELTIKGWTQRDIAYELKRDVAMINRDLKYMRQQAKQNIQHYIDEYLPAEYQHCLDTLNMIIKEMWQLRTEDNRELVQARTLIKDCCAMRIDLLSNATVVGRAIDFINKHRGLLVR
jgi:predicted solute-binding protein